MRSVPHVQVYGSMALVHASPESLWRAPGSAATDAELENTFGSLGKDLVIFGHIHRPFVRTLPTVNRELTIANTGSVSLSYDGDCRAAYLLIDTGNPTIRRVEYDIETEIQALSACGLPHSDWVSRMLRTGTPQMP
jgi:hypothetical protein